MKEKFNILFWKVRMKFLDIMIKWEEKQLETNFLILRHRLARIRKEVMKGEI